MIIKKKVEYTFIEGDEKLIVTILNNGDIEYLNVRLKRNSKLTEIALKHIKDENRTN